MGKLCILCRVSEAETSEHFPFKASLIAKSLKFNDAISVGNVREIDAFNTIHSARDKNFTPEKNLCFSCNNKKTRKCDIEFDKSLTILYENVKRSVASMITTSKSLEIELYDFELELNRINQVMLKRYFAKLLCCELDVRKQVVPEILGDFAIGNHVANECRIQAHFEKLWVMNLLKMGISNVNQLKSINMSYDPEQGSDGVYRYKLLVLGCVVYQFSFAAN